MKNMFRIQLICLACLAIIFTAGCSVNENESITEQNQEVYTFIPQEPQPIEENPFMLPMETHSESGLHRLLVEKPNMDEITHSDDVINAIFGSAVLIAELQNPDLINSGYLETGDQQVNNTLSDNNEFLEVFIQRANIEQGDAVQDTFSELWGEISIDVMSSNAFSTGKMNDLSNSAILFKYRYRSPIRGIQTSLYNGSVNIRTGISNDNHLFTDAGTDSLGYSTDNRSDHINFLDFVENEWYFTLLALDQDYGYRYITWQENNPQNNAFYACDLGLVFKPYNLVQEQGFRGNLYFLSPTDEINVEIESLSIYEFDNFIDIENSSQKDNNEVYEYSNDQEKYQLAVDLFKGEDYYNAYTLFKEIDGFDTSKYLVECERLLGTIEIKNPYVAGMIKKALKDRSMPIYEYLFVYQAEKLESLDLSECRIEDLGFVHNFINLKELNLNKNAISDLTPLTSLQALEILSLGKNNITDITPLQDLANLQVLDLHDNLLEDVAAINNLTSLKVLNLSTNNIFTIDSLCDLENLESVDLSYNFVSSINALENSPINELNIMNTDINNLESVANFNELEALKAGFRYIWKGNEGYLVTRKYEMENHFFDGLSGLDAIAGHPNLKKLYLARLNVETLEPITTIPNLESLFFHQYSGSGDPGVLSSLVNLKGLALDSFGIGFYDTSFLSNLTKLEKLYIGTFCTVDDLSVISELKNLEELRMYKYGDDLSFLSGLHNLRLLELLYWDTVDDYSPLLALDQLEHLSLREMTVHDLSVISQIENLRFLRMDNSQVNNITDISKLNNLECLSMENLHLIEDNKPELYERSLFSQLDHLQLLHISAAGGGWGYDFGDPEFLESINEPLDTGVVIPDYDYFWVENLDDVNRLHDYVGSHHQVVDGLFFSDGESIKLTIPKYVRNLYIFSYSDQPVKLEIDGANNKGLERIVVGHIDVSRDDPDGFGQGNFIIENLDGLSGCTNLKEIYIDAARIDDISALSNLDKLEILELPGNNIMDISVIAD